MLVVAALIVFRVLSACGLRHTNSANTGISSCSAPHVSSTSKYTHGLWLLKAFWVSCQMRSLASVASSPELLIITSKALVSGAMVKPK